jgi:hypothetical protein
MSPNTSTVTVVSPSTIIAVFDSSRPFSCPLPAFFLAVSSWSRESERPVLIGGSSAQYVYVGQPVKLGVTTTCSPGYFVNISAAMLRNVTAMYDFLLSISSSVQLCSRCTPGTFSTSDTVSFCPNCTGGTFANANNTECLQCPVGTWSRNGMQGACRACSSNATTTREQDHCVTLQFLHPPPMTMVSGASNLLPAVALVDFFDSSIVSRSGLVSIQLQCILPGCQTDSNAEFNLVTRSLYVTNGSSPTAEVFFLESSQIKIGTGFVWRIFTTQEPLSLASSNIDSLQSAYRIIFLGEAASISEVAPTQVASAGGTDVRVFSIWKLSPRIQSVFVNDSAFCIFHFIDNAVNVSNTSVFGGMMKIERIPALATLQETVKTCKTPVIPEFSFVNLSIVLQDGRRSTNPFLLQSVCHNNYFLNASKCQPCPVSSLGHSSNTLINAMSLELCICSAGSYGTHGAFCSFCPAPSSLPSPPFICNSSNLRYPVVAPGYWADFSLLSRCNKDATLCPAVITCAFGARACPGGGEKVCTQHDEECYQGKGCSNCCPAYYNENNACFKCPDSTQTTALLAVVGIFCVTLAVLMSSISTPSFTQSSKSEYICKNLSR